MSGKLCGSVKRVPRYGGGYYLLCVTLLYGFVLLFRFAAKVAGYRRTGELIQREETLFLTETTTLLGAVVSRQERAIPLASLREVSRTRGGDLGLLVMGASLLFYGTLLGVYKVITGLLGAQGALLFWGLGLFVGGIVLDLLLFSLHFQLTKRRGEGIVLSTGTREWALFFGKSELTDIPLEGLRRYLS